MMASRFPLFNAQRRSIAVGIWTLLIAPIGLIEGQPAFWTASIAVSLIASLSAFATLLVNRDTSRASHWMPIAIGAIVPFVWALLFSTAPADLMLFAFFAFLPAAYVGLTLTSKHDTDRMTFSEQSVKHSALLDVIASTISFDDTASQNDDLASEEEFEDDEASNNLTHWLRRSWTDAGDLIEGGLRVDFSEGQRETTVHVSFCPPFQSTPEISTEDLNGDDIEIRVAAVFPFGMRLTIRRPPAAVGQSKVLPSASTQIGFVAVASDVRRAA